MNDYKELIEEARDMTLYARTTKHGAVSHADMIDDLADALEASLSARQPSEDDREEVAKQLRSIGAVKSGKPAFYKDDPEERVVAPLSVVLDLLATRAVRQLSEEEREAMAQREAEEYAPGDMEGQDDFLTGWRTADRNPRVAVPDAATERVTESSVRHVKRLTTELQNRRESLNDQRREFRKLLADARAERDAALVVIWRVRAAVVKGSLMDPNPTRMEPDTARESELWWQSYHLRADEAWRLNIRAALDGAPEPGRNAVTMSDRTHEELVTAALYEFEPDLHDAPGKNSLFACIRARIALSALRAHGRLTMPDSSPEREWEWGVTTVRGIVPHASREEAELHAETLRQAIESGAEPGDLNENCQVKKRTAEFVTPAGPWLPVEGESK